MKNTTPATRSDIEAGYEAKHISLIKVPVGDVRERDILDGRAEVTDVTKSSRSDRVTIRLSSRMDGKTVHQYTASDTVSVVRQVLTKAGRRAKDDARNVERYTMALASAHAAVERAQRELNEELAKPYQTSYHYFGNLFEADAWLYIMKGVEYFTTKNGEDENGDKYEVDVPMAEALRQSVERYTSNLTERYTRRGLSRSTAVLSNLQEDVEQEQMAKFIDMFGKNRRGW